VNGPPIPDVSGALLSVTWRAVGTHRVLALYDDRSAWLWRLAGAGEGDDVVGSFRVDPGAVPDEAWEAARAVARDVAAGRLGGEPDPGVLGLALTAGGSAAWVALGTADAAAVGDAAAPLVALAQESPAAAARFATRVVTAPTGALVAAFTATGTGTGPVTLRLDPSGLALALADGGRVAVPAPEMGLVDADVRLLDGIHQPATLEPGVLGACTVPLDDAPPSAVLAGVVRGWVGLVGPWDGFPEAGFEAVGPAA
jgi:hypothetical protein